MTSSSQLDIKIENEELGSFGEVNDIAEPEVPIPKQAPVTTTKSKKKRDASTLRKAPQAPKRFKSSYILFFMGKQQEIKEELGASATVGDVSKRSSEMWKTLPPDERAHWDEVAKKDKERYMAEKAMYTGPWQVPWKRAKKDPSAPKRPMSAFLYFSQDKRRKIKDANPGMRNTEVSRILGGMWKNAADGDRNPHIEREAAERAKYKIAISKWRKEDAIRKEAEKKAQQEQAKYTPPPVQNYNSYSSSNPPPEGQYYPPSAQQPPPYPESNQYYPYGPPRGPYSNYMNPPQYPASSQHPQSHHQQPPPSAYYGYPPNAPHVAPNNSYPPQKQESPDSPPNSSYPPSAYPPSQDSYGGGYYENNAPQGYQQQPMPPHYQQQPPPQQYEQEGARYEHEQHPPRYNDAPIRYDEGPPPSHPYHHEHEHYAAH